MADNQEKKPKKEFFTAEKRKQAIDWIDKNNPVCEVCGKDKWTLVPDLISPALFEGGMVIGGMTYPQVMIVCNTCGNTKYFNAIVIGVLDLKEEEKESGDDK